MNKEIVRLDSQRLFELEIVFGVCEHQVKALEERSNRDDDFLPGKCTPLSGVHYGR
jgi:hypothetical protein